MKKDNLLPSENCFHGIYCFDAQELVEARKIHGEGDTVKARSLYLEVMLAYTKKLEKVIHRESKESTTFVSPTCILTETKFDADLKKLSSIYELSAKINLAKAMVDLIEGDKKSCTERITEAGDFYKKEASCLSSLAASCSPYEDVAQIMFECEMEEAKEVADHLLEIFLWRFE